MGGICTTSCRPQIPKDENSPVKTKRKFFVKTKVFSGGYNLTPKKYIPVQAYDFNSYPVIDKPLPQTATIDINNAVEEDLMTIPGINRELAKHIVAYRQSIGMFKKVEDLAPCVGAANFEKFYNEFHVKNVNNNLRNSSKSLVSNVSDLSIIHSVVSINKATIAQLSKIPNIRESDARKIVQYRQKKGNFKNINELVEPSKILNVQDFMKVKHQLTVSLKSRSSLYQPQSLMNNAQINFSNSFNTNSNRPSLPQFSIFEENTYNVCSWNLEKCNIEKIENSGVKEVFCMTILENRVSILAVQGISSHKVLETLVYELNFPSLPSVEQHNNNNKNWKCYSSFKNFILQSHTTEFDSNVGVGFVWNSTSSASFTEHNYNTILGLFKIKEVTLNLLNVYSIGNNTMRNKLNDFIDNNLNESESNTVMMSSEFQNNLFQPENYQPVFNEPTNITTSNLNGTCCKDNIYVNNSFIKNYKYEKQIIRKGLTNPLIPNGWKLNGIATSHCPIIMHLSIS